LPESLSKRGGGHDSGSARIDRSYEASGTLIGPELAMEEIVISAGPYIWTRALELDIEPPSPEDMGDVNLISSTLLPGEGRSFDRPLEGTVIGPEFLRPVLSLPPGNVSLPYTINCEDGYLELKVENLDWVEHSYLLYIEGGVIPHIWEVE
jgi:hypothetical protein